MSFLKEKLNAFIGQPIEKKRSDHRLKNVESCTDSRAWVLDEELKRQHFLSVVNRETGGGGAGEGEEDELSKPSPRGFLPEDTAFELEERIKDLEGDKDFLKNVIADKENEIERLLYRIRAMAEVEPSGMGPNDTALLQSQLSELMKQYNTKDEELKKTKDKLINTERILNDLQMLLDSAGDDPEKQKEQLDKVMKNLQTGMQDDIESLKNQVQTLEDKLLTANVEIAELVKDLNSAQEQIETLASGDENELNKLILGLRNELMNVKASKDAENKALRDIIDQKDNELKKTKDVSNEQVRKGSEPTNIKDFSGIGDDTMQNIIAEKDREINTLQNKLDDEKRHNNALKDQLNLLAAGDENDLKSTILALTAELEDLKSKKTNQESPNLSSGQNQPLIDELQDNIKNLERMLNNEKQLNNELNKELQNLRDKFINLASADDNELKKMLANSENEIEMLKNEKDINNATIQYLGDEIDRLKSALTKEKQEPEKVNVDKSRKGPDVQGDIERLTKENVDLKNENESLKNEINKLNMKMSKEFPLMSPSNEQLHSKPATDENSQAPKDMNELLNELKHLRAENRGLKDMLKKYESEGLKPEVETLTKSELKEKDPIIRDGVNIQEILDKNKKLMFDNEELKNENHSLKKAIKDKGNEVVQDKPLPPDVDGSPNILATDDTNKDSLKSENDRLNNALKKEIDGKISLQNKLNDLEKQNNDLKNELKALHQVSDNLDDENKQLIRGDDTISNLKDTILKLEKEKLDLENQLQKPVQSSGQPFEELQNTIKELQEANNNLKESAKKDKDKYNKNLSDKDKNIEMLQNTITDLQKDNNQLKLNTDKTKRDEPEAKPLEENSNNVSEENSNLKKENEKLKNEINALQKQKMPPSQTGEQHDVKKCDKEKQNLMEEIEKLKNYIDSLQTNLKDSAIQDQPLSKSQIEDISKPEEAKNLIKENDNLKNEIKALKKKIDDNKNLDNEQKALSTQENIKLKEEVNTLKNELEDLKNKYLRAAKEKEVAPPLDNKNVLAENEKLKSELKDLQEKVKSLEKPKTNEKVDIAKDDQNNAKLTEENKVLKETIKMMEDLINKGATSQEQGTDKKIDSQEILKLMNENQNLKKANEKLMEDVERLTNELEEAKSLSKDNTSEPKISDKKQSEVIEENKKLKQKVKSLEDEIKNMKANVPSGLERNEKLEPSTFDTDDIKKLKADNLKLSKENDNLKAEIQSLKNKLLGISEKPEETKLDNDDLKKTKENKSLSDKLKQVEENSGVTKKSEATADSKGGEIKALKDKIKILEDENEDLKSKLKDLNKALTNANNQKLASEDENKKLLDMINKAEEAGGFSEDEMLNMHKTNADKFRKENDKLKDRISELEKELDDLRDKNRKLQNRQENNKPLQSVNKEQVSKSPLTPQDPKEKMSLKGKEKMSPNLEKPQKVQPQEKQTDKTDAKGEKDKKILQPTEGEKATTAKSPLDQSTATKEPKSKTPEPDKGKKEKLERLQDDKELMDGSISPSQPRTKRQVQMSENSKPDLVITGQKGVKVTTPQSPLDQSTASKEPKSKTPDPDKGKKEKLERPQDDKELMDGSISPSRPRTKRQVQMSENSKPDLVITGQQKKDAESFDKQSPVSKERQRETQKTKLDPEKKEKVPTTKSGKKDTDKDVETQQQKKIGDPLETKTVSTKEEKVKGVSPERGKTTDKEILKETDESTLKLKGDYRKVKPFKDSPKAEKDPESKYIPEKEQYKTQKKEIPPKKLVSKDTKSDKYETQELELGVSKAEERGNHTKVPRKEFDKKETISDNLKKGEPFKDKHKKNELDETVASTKQEPFKKKRAKSLDLQMKRRALEEIPVTDQDLHGDKEKDSTDRKTKEPLKYRKTFVDQSETSKHTLLELSYEGSKGFGDKDYDNELNQLKKKLYESEKLIERLTNEISKLKTKNQDLKQMKFPQDVSSGAPAKYGDFEKYQDENTKKLNKILQKAIRNGLKSLYLDELEFVHDSLNNTMAQRQGRPATPGRKSPEELENIINIMEQRMISLMRRLENYRQHSSEQEKRIMDYSQKVQRLNTSVGLLEMKMESLQYESKQLRDLVSYEKEKSKKLEDMLKSVLDNCKCTRKWVLHQNYPGLYKT